MNVAYGIELTPDRSFVDLRFELLEPRCRHVAGADGIERRIGGQHARPHGEVDAFQPHRIHEPGRVTNDERAARVTARNRVPAALGQRFRAVAHHLPAFDDLPDERVQLEAVEGDVRVEHWISVVEASDESDRDLTFRHRVDKTAAELLEAERVTHRMDDRASPHAVGWHFPQFLDPDRVERRLLAGSELQPSHQLLRQIAADAVGEDGHLRANVDAGFERRLARAMFVDAAVAGPDTPNRIALHQDVRTGEPREDIDPFGVGEAPGPPDESIQRDDVVAMIGERRWSKRKFDLAAFGEKVDAVLMHWRRQRRTL